VEQFQSTTIEYQVPKQSSIKINIYNANGQLIKELVNEERDIGSYSAKWNGRDDKGNLVASGTYFYQIQTGNFVQAK
jgi:flagellar hook assembly protein FlgD